MTQGTTAIVDDTPRPAAPARGHHRAVTARETATETATPVAEAATTVTVLETATAAMTGETTAASATRPVAARVHPQPAATGLETATPIATDATMTGIDVGALRLVDLAHLVPLVRRLRTGATA
jgi:hypothetical protein